MLATSPAAPRRCHQVRQITAVVLPPAAVAAACIALWWLTPIVFGIDSYLAPTPPQVITALLRSPAHLAANARTTLLEVVHGYTITVGLGLTTGTLLAASRTVERAVMPTIVAVNAIPKLAFAPLLLVWMGFGHAPKVVMVILLGYFPITLAAVSGLTRTPTELTDLARSLNASRWQTLTRIRLPAALPQIFVGLKTAMPLAVIGALVGELSGATAGLGWIIQNAGPDTPTAFAAILLLALISVALFYTLTLAERLILPWARETTS